VDVTYPAAMEPTFAAAAKFARELFEEFAETVASVPREALDWHPAPGTSSLAQLAAHAATSTRFWMAAAVGQRRDILGYRRGERERAFATAGTTPGELAALLRAAGEEVARLAELGRPEQLGQLIAWADDDGTAPVLTGAEALVRAVSHLREHLGHAQLTRDLWRAQEQAR